jgi:hypothetical protein
MLQKLVGELGSQRPAVRLDRAESVNLTALTEEIDSWVGKLAEDIGFAESVLNEARVRTRQECLIALRRLEDRLRIAGPTGEGWKEYVELPRLKAAFSSRENWPQDLLQRVYQRLASGHPGLEIKAFADLRQAIRGYLLCEQFSANREAVGQMVEVGKELATELRSYQAQPTAAGLSAIARRWAWYQVLGITPAWGGRLQEAFAGPNLRFQVSEQLVSTVVAREVDDIGPFEDVILGTQLFGKSKTRGQLCARLVPQEQTGVVSISFRGKIETEAVGFNGPVQVNTCGHTQISAEKLLGFGSKNLVLLPTFSRAETESELLGLYALRGGALVESIAWRRAFRQKPLADAIAARHAEERFNSRLDNEFAARTRTVAQWWQEKVLDPLEDRGIYPPNVRWRTTAENLEGYFWQWGRGRLAAPVEPPAAHPEADLAVAVHESAINGVLAETFSRYVLREMGLREWVEDFLGRVPAWMEVEDPAEPWTIFLADDQPLEVAFWANHIRVTIRGRAFQKGDRSYPGMEVTAEYRLEGTGEGSQAIRQGELKIYPPGFEPGKGRLSAREQVLRTLLERRFSKVFPERWEIPVLRWNREKEKLPAIELKACGWQAEQGWMVLSWKLAR